MMSDSPEPPNPTAEPESERLMQVWEALDERSRSKLLEQAGRLLQQRSSQSATEPPPIETPTLPTHLHVTAGKPYQRAMIFVDGENLSRRYGDALKTSNRKPVPDATYLPGVLIWRRTWQLTGGIPNIVRKHYYTSTRGDAQHVVQAQTMLKEAGIESPQVFRRGRDERSKQVDIALSTEMLLQATRRTCDVAVLITGDADFIPLVKAVQGEGVHVQVWALSNGLSPELRLAADSFVCLDEFLVGPP